MAATTLFSDALKPFAFTTQTEPEVVIRGVSSGDAASSSLPPLLLLHGFPQTCQIWHRVVPHLLSRYTVVLPDIRGYGQSSKPHGVAQYAKSAMARDMVSVMDQLGYGAQQPFYVVGHDRGARVSHKLLVDYPDRVKAAILLDVSPTLRMYEATDVDVASVYFHWFFLIQPAPFPETLMAAQPGVFLDRFMGGYVGARADGKLKGRFDDHCLDVYLAAMADPDTARAMCDDYRAARELDLVEQKADKEAGRLIKSPLRVLWASQGLIEKKFACIQDWQDVTDPSITVQGHRVTGTHYIPEENADEVVREVLEFFV